MLEKIKYNFWLLVFIVNTLFFLFFLYQAFSFTSVYAYRWLFFLSAPFFTSGIHLLIKSRSTNAEWLSVINFGLTAGMIVFFNAVPDALESRWHWFIIPIFNQLYINTFDVIWSNQYPYRMLGVLAVSILWTFTLISTLSAFTWFFAWILPLSIVVSIIILMLIYLNHRKTEKS